ncbi:MAG TPA: terminase family protein [Vicinamibacterales bacterium]|jgi:phage terminase large subunit-like protein|nr:terminase family protein [Vicinamibacterales bacterium]
MNEDEIASLYFDWAFWQRPDQRPPAEFVAGLKTYWLVDAGRGYGKTRVGAEQTREWARSNQYVNLVGATLDDVRDIMIEGESGILAICPRNERPDYVGRQLRWPSGCKSLIFTADEPDRLRGKQHAKVWADELAAWRYAESWDQVQFGLRLGRTPQAIVTTTPRPIKVVRELLTDPACVVTRGTSYDNRDNLPAVYYSTIIRKYEGTRLGRQELNAELLEDNPGALWNHRNLDQHRVRSAPTLRRVVVALDPSASSEEGVASEAGIIAAGVDERNPPHFFVLGDTSKRDHPAAWAKTAVATLRSFNGDRVIGEANNGGDMIEALLRAVDPNVPYTKVTASRGKQTRAEPIAALYEQGRVHHVGSFPQLEDQMCDYDPLTAKTSPDRMDALVWALTALADNTERSLLDFYQQQAQRAAA